MMSNSEIGLTRIIHGISFMQMRGVETEGILWYFKGFATKQMHEDNPKTSKFGFNKIRKTHF